MPARVEGNSGRPATFGAPQVIAELRENGEQVGYNRVGRLMRNAGLVGASRRKGCWTTESTENHFQGFVSRLKYSRWVDVRVGENEGVEALVRSQLVGFASFGGLPLVAVFDNPKTVVISREGGNLGPELVSEGRSRVLCGRRASVSRDGIVSP